MPGGRTKFQTKWLERRDGNGDLISNWCSKGQNDHEAYCLLCKCYFSVSNSGISQLLQHASKQKHTRNSKLLKGQRTLVGKDINDTPSIINSNSHTESRSLSLMLSTEQLTTRAEALWVMKVAVSNFSFAANKDIVQLFQMMFEGHPVSSRMHLSDRKISYVLSHGLGPFFLQQTVQDLKTAVKSECWFSLAFDETTTSQVKKQLDIHIRYWSPTSNSVVCVYLNSVFLGHATASIICSSIMDTLNSNSLPLSKLLMLSMDGPNVNHAVAKMLNDELAKLGAPELVDLGTCSLHKVHNAFSKALNCLPLDVDQFATDLFGFFKFSAARREDFRELQNLLECEEKYLLQHVSSRWITLGPVVVRILSIYAALEEYFLKFLPKQKDSWRTVQHNLRYQRIASTLKKPSTRAFLEFISALTPVLKRYLSLFETEGPLIHLLYNKMNELLRNVMLKFLKEECVLEAEGKKIINIDLEKQENFKPISSLDIGIGSTRILSCLKESEAKTARMAMRRFFIELCKYLKESLPISSGFLRDLEKLHPLMRSPNNDNAIRRLCVRMKPLKMNDFTIDRVVHEWKMYRLDPEVDLLCNNFRTAITASEQSQDNLEKVRYERIDKYWRSVFELTDKSTGYFKYLNLAKLVKSCLSLAHGNSDVERGFSVNNAIISKDKPNISEAVVIGIRAVKDAVRRCGSISNIPITEKVLESVAEAHSAYMKAKQEQKKIEDEKRKRALERSELEQQSSSAKRHKEDIAEKIAKLDGLIESLKADLTAARAVLNEGNERLQTSIKRKNFADIRIASTMIETGTKKIHHLTTKLTESQENKMKLQSAK